VGDVSVVALGEDRFRIVSPEGEREAEGFERARSLATLRDTCRAMSEESTTPDLVALTRALGEANLDETMAFLGPNAVYDASHTGMEIVEGREAVRTVMQGWQSNYDDYEEETEEILDLGNGVVLAITRSRGRLRDSQTSTRLESRMGLVIEWRGDKVARMTPYPDADEARAAAERLAVERG
jgi:ketosteroid isomerase-like protein